MRKFAALIVGVVHKCALKKMRRLSYGIREHE